MTQESRTAIFAEFRILAETCRAFVTPDSQAWQAVPIPEIPAGAGFAFERRFAILEQKKGASCSEKLLENTGTSASFSCVPDWA